MRICVILEGCYPYVTGGVSSWMQQYIEAMPQHEFIIWAVGADSKDRGKFRYKLPANVIQVQEVFLNDALKLSYIPEKYDFSEKEKEALRSFIRCGKPDWSTLFELYAVRKVAPLAFLMSEDFLNLLTEICEEEYPYTAFSDLFHTIRSMLLPVLHIMGSEVPKADIYHAISTGYSGVLASLGAWLNHVPFEITEHGIYTREREEEIIRADWVLPDFKKFWVRFFYMLSDCAYSRASYVTSLFKGARDIQISMGCREDISRYIGNGVHYERFKDIPPKQQNGFIDIGAVLRIAPIKDVKTMLYAFAEMKKSVPNARLWVAGPEDDKKYAGECYDLIKQLRVDDVNFLGTINVLEYLGKFDFTMLSSISEGMPLSVLESFSAGVPCITTDVGCCRELLYKAAEDDDLGAAGICVPPMHIREMADAMVRMSRKTEERLRMGQTGRRRVERYFLHEDMIRKYLEVYDEVFKRWQASASV